LNEYPIKPGAVVRGLDRRREEESENEAGSPAAAAAALGAEEGASDSTSISAISRMSDGGGGESVEIVELSIEKHWHWQ